MVICNECDYPAELVEPWKCPNPACHPGDAAYRSARRAWESARKAWVQEQQDRNARTGVWINQRAFEDNYARLFPFPSDAAFPYADPPWREA